MRAGIVGGGIMGRLLAFALAQSQWRVTLFDFKQSENCSQAAAGLLSPVAELEKNDWFIFQLGREALDLHWPRILSQLPRDIYFKKEGSLVLAHPRDGAELTHYLRRIADKWGDYSFCQLLEAKALSLLEPELPSIHQACYFPGEGQMDSQALLEALELAFRLDEKQLLIDAYVETVSPGKVRYQNKDLRFDCVFDCRGLGAQGRFQKLRAVRGELIWLEAKGLHLQRPLRLLHPRYSLYLVPRPQQKYLIGASEIEALDYSPLSLRGALELLTSAYSIHPGFSEARILKCVTQCRPTLPDQLPRIQYSSGLIAVNGLYRHGFLIAPSLVADIQGWLQGGLSQVRYPALWEAAA